MKKVLTLNKISPKGLDQFDVRNYTYGSHIEDPAAILVRSASMHEMQLPESLLAVARAGAGVNNIPIEACSEKGIVVFNTPGANANAVKEMVMCGLLLASRKVLPAIEWCKTLKEKGDDVPSLVEKGKSAFSGPEIRGKKLGVIGLGAIGILVANEARHLGMQVYGYDPFMSIDAAWSLSSSIKRAKSVAEIYSECDYISVHIPLNNETRDMINENSIDGMKDGVRILNFSRGELVNTQDILDALERGKVTAYVTDFPNAQLIGKPGVIAIPHLGASTPESEENCAAMAVYQIMDYLENGNIKNSVNLPDVDLPRTSQTRICIIHKNKPKMLTAITEIASRDNLNIDNLINKGKKDYAYTVLDVAGVLPSDVRNEFLAIDGVQRVRIIKNA